MKKLNFSTGRVHCDSGTDAAFFGGGTKLTVLGKKSKQFQHLANTVYVPLGYYVKTYCCANDREAYFGQGTKLTVVGKTFCSRGEKARENSNSCSKQQR